MSVVVEIQPAGTRDIEAILPMVEQYWRFEAIEGFDRHRLDDLLRRVFRDPSLGRAWLATVDGAPAGYLLAVYVFSLEHQGVTAEIDEFFIAPEHRKLGLGSRMLAEAEAQFRVAGCTNVSLQLGRSNDAARAFYRRHGFADRAGFEFVSKNL